MKDVINIEMVDNGYIMRGEDFAQVINVTEGRDENMNLQLGNYLYGLMHQSMNDFCSCKVKIEINITKCRSLTKQ